MQKLTYNHQHISGLCGTTGHSMAQRPTVLCSAAFALASKSCSIHWLDSAHFKRTTCVHQQLVWLEVRQSIQPVYATGPSCKGNCSRAQHSTAQTAEHNKGKRNHSRSACQTAVMAIAVKQVCNRGSTGEICSRQVQQQQQRVTYPQQCGNSCSTVGKNGNTQQQLKV